MNLLAAVFFIFSIAFFIAFIKRYDKKGCLIEAKLTQVDEGVIDSLQLYNKIRYFYPLITYQFEVDGKVINGKTLKKNSRAYRVNEYDAFGSINENDKFFWRGLTVGEKIDVFYDEKDLQKNWLSKGKTKTYKSETKALLIIAIIFLLLAFLSSIYF